MTQTSSTDNSTVTTRAAPEISCPRCGFDARGQVIQWVDSCPLRMTCSECGLEFDTGRAARVTLLYLPWLIECRPAWSRSWLSAIVSSSCRALAPNVFWSRLDMGLQYRPRRILLAIGLIGALIFATMMSGYALYVAATYRQSVRNLPQFHQQVIQFHQSRVASLSGDMMYVTSATKASELQAEMQRHQAMIAAMPVNPRADGSVMQEVFRCLIRPWSDRTQSTTNLKSSLVWHPSPRDMLAESLAITPGPVAKRLGNLGFIWAAMTFGMPLFLWCLPQSRRIAKVRARHVVRSCLYGLCTSMSAMLAVSILYLGSMASSSLPGSFEVEHALLRLTIFWSFWILIWWFVVIEIYMQLPHSKSIVILALVIIGLLVVILNSPSDLIRPFVEYLMGV